MIGFGQAMGSLISPAIIQGVNGWRSSFFVIGVLPVLFFPFWLSGNYASPRLHSGISPAELAAIELDHRKHRGDKVSHSWSFKVNMATWLRHCAK